MDKAGGSQQRKARTFFVYMPHLLYPRSDVFLSFIRRGAVPSNRSNQSMQLHWPHWPLGQWSHTGILYVYFVHC